MKEKSQNDPLPLEKLTAKGPALLGLKQNFQDVMCISRSKTLIKFDVWRFL